MILVQHFEEDKRNIEKFRNKNAKTTGNESRQQKGNVNQLSFQQKPIGPAPSSASASAPRKKGEFKKQYSPNLRARPAHSQGSISQGGNCTPACAKCGRNHLGTCRDASANCYKCCQVGRFMREWPKNLHGNGNGNGGNRAKSSLVAPPDST
ncbi:hypothetical protein H5410_046607 [Solanum commersonii]|uniref:Gag-pol polyprotein n=1 Tax=Solanum commersonii TaxID=4109 RepID=A0A9J5XET3_SOLCO|nr:hypothetical protein H5410_046607 [Solanum commersonii]